MVERKSDDLEEDGSYEIESIVSHRLHEGNYLYTVKWKGFDERYNDEIPYENFDSKAIVIEYYKKLNEQNPHKIAKNKRKLKKQIKRYEKSNKKAKLN